MIALTEHLYNVLLGLTPLQRLDAIRKYHTDPATHRLFVIIGLLMVSILMFLLIRSIYYRKKNDPRSSVRLFDKYAEAKSLTDREYRILMNMAISAGLRRYEFIFTLPSAFDRQAALLAEDIRTNRGTEESQKIQMELAILREKLDFRHYTSPDTVTVIDSETQSSRTIPLKKKIYIKCNHRSSNGNFEAMVIKNTSDGLTVQFGTPVEIVFGQPWVCRYYTSGFVAEFNTTVIKCSGHIVLLSHNDNVRLINRRRFLRVPIKQPAYVANFPFKKESSTNITVSNKTQTVYSELNEMEQYFQPPHFVPATVTELGGPGLRIRTHLHLEVNDRVLLMFKLDQNKKESTSQYAATEKSIEHIGIVRHIITDEKGSSAAIELIGLNDSSIDELIRATNEASIKFNKQRNSYRITQRHKAKTPQLVTA